MTTRLFLFDDARARQWEPFALTRPGAELVLGQANRVEGWVTSDAEVVVLLQETGTGQKRLVR